MRTISYALILTVNLMSVSVNLQANASERLLADNPALHSVSTSATAMTADSANTIEAVLLARSTNTLNSQLALKPSIWFSASGQLSERALGLYAAIELAEKNRIAVDDLRSQLQGTLTLEQFEQAHFSVLEQLIKRFSIGQISQGIDPLWKHPAPLFDLQTVRAEILASSSLFTALADRLPKHADYIALLSAYEKLRSLDAEPPKVVFVDYLKQGDVQPTIAQVRARLSWLGYAATDAVSELAPNLYDQQLAQQVRLFQNDHGLDQDAVIGPDTLRWLNLAADERRTIITTVLERWRWLSRDLGQEYLLVNIPGFEVQYFAESRPVQRYTSISGRPTRPTSSFSARIEQLVVNPDWTVPKRILLRDLVPKILSSSDYLEQQGMQAQRLIAGRWQTVANDSVNWQALTWSDQDIRVQQAPSAHNALGQIKFHMPNAHAIYLHDTPSKSLFSDTSRAFSSGCIRVKGVADLARTLMHEKSTQLEQSLLQTETQWIRLPNPVPVYLVYNRAWVDAKGHLQFRDDIYNADKALSKALKSMLKNSHLAER